MVAVNGRTYCRATTARKLRGHHKVQVVRDVQRYTVPVVEMVCATVVSGDRRSTL